MLGRRYFIVLLLLFSATVSFAQNDSVLIRKGATVSFQNGSTLTRSEIVALLDSCDYVLYKHGRQNVVGSVPLYVVSATSVGLMVVIWLYENDFYSNLKFVNFHSERNRQHVGDERLVFQITPPIYFYLAQCASFTVAMTTGLLAHRLNSNGKHMIDVACGNWNAKAARQSAPPTLSFSASPVDFTVTLHF